jgi:GTP cyclohydrolase I
MASGNTDAPTLAALLEHGPLLGRDPINLEKVARAYEDLLDEVSPGWAADPHMMDTPGRAAKFWREFIDYDPGKSATTFAVEKADQMVAVTGIEAWSLCAHHLLPFSASISVAYLAQDKVLGLSKFSRLAHLAAHRPTSQEALVNTLADLIEEATGTRDVAVQASGLHLCMAMRGVKEQSAKMTTSVLRGQFRHDPAVREEWLAILAK